MRPPTDSESVNPPAASDTPSAPGQAGTGPAFKKRRHIRWTEAETTALCEAAERHKREKRVNWAAVKRDLVAAGFEARDTASYSDRCRVAKSRKDAGVSCKQGSLDLTLLEINLKRYR